MPELLSIEKCSFVKVGAFSTIVAGGVHLLTFNAARGVHHGTIVGDAQQTVASVNKGIDACERD